MARIVPPRDTNPKGKNAPRHYYQSGYDEPILADGYEEMINNILQFRLDNDLDIGNPKEDYEDFLRHQFPGFETKAKKRPGTSPAENRRNLMDQVRAWVRGAKEKEWKAEYQEVAEERAEICSGCPFNREHISQCSPCINKLERQVTMLTQNRQTKAKVGACVNLKQDNRVAIWMPAEALSDAKVNHNTPDFCWVKNL